MAPKFAVGLRACGVAVALLLATAEAAQQTPSPLIGATREQVLARHGEPRSQIVVGNRVIMYFADQRVVLRDGKVVEVERLAEEPRRAPATAPTTAPAPAPADAEKQASQTATPKPADSAGAAAAPGPAPTDPTGAPVPVVPPAPKFEIKMVRPPGSPPLQDTPAPQAAPTSPTTGPAVAVSSPAPVVPPAKAPTGAGSTPAPGSSTKSPAAAAPRTDITSVPAAPPPTKAEATPPAPVQSTPTPTAPVPEPATARQTTTTAPAAKSETTKAKATAVTAKDEESAKTDEPAADPATEKKKKAPKVSTRKLMEAQESDPDERFFGPREYGVALLILGGGIGFLFWRRRQRQLELAASAVSRTPFSAPAPTTGGTVFTLELLGKLEWKRFEELVAAYYSKTGVVAARTRIGPNSPVNIKISWKGEPRPFACVRCIGHAPTLIDAKPLQDLVAMLAEEDIRRGYVVTTGRFSVAARDLAEEKHLTLLPGDIFLEKLNALPDSARQELMQQATAGDYTTPSCPTCDAKMVRSPEDPAMWHCPTHPEQQIPARK